MAVVVNKRLFNAKEAANYLSISRTLLYHIASKGNVLGVNINTRRLFDINNLDDFIEKSKIEQRE